MRPPRILGQAHSHTHHADDDDDEDDDEDFDEDEDDDEAPPVKKVAAPAAKRTKTA